MNDFIDIVSKAMEVRPDEGDYTGKDGLLYCGKCHTPKEAYFEDGHIALLGRDRHPTNCAKIVYHWFFRIISYLII